MARERTHGGGQAGAVGTERRQPGGDVQSADDVEDVLDGLDVDAVEVDATEDLRAIAVAADIVVAAEAQLREAVEVARAHGRSWNRIAVPLGVSRQAARVRYSGADVPAPRLAGPGAARIQRIMLAELQKQQLEALRKQR